jgi:hypothetical protein
MDMQPAPQASAALAPETSSRRTAPITAAEISIPADWALVPTEEELRAADRARAAFKAEQRYLAQPDHYQLEQQQRRGGL